MNYITYTPSIYRKQHCGFGDIIKLSLDGLSTGRPGGII